MLQKIESINLLQLAKNINHIIFEGKLQLNTDEYEIEIEKSNNVTDLQPLLKLLSLMVKDSYLVTEIYFESEADFERCCGISYDKRVNEIVHSIRIDKIKFANKDSYSGTLIYHEAYNGKLRFELDCIKYLTRFQKECLWEDGNQ